MNKPAVLLVTMVLLLIALSGFDSSFSFEKDFPADLNGPDVLAFANLVGTVEIAREKFRSLSVAMPEDAYLWRPMDGVRSVSEVYQHIAADNFFVPTLMGIAAPPETGINEDASTFRAFQERELTRDEVIETVEASFEFLSRAMQATASDLDRHITLGTSETTVGDVWIRAVVHLHEHLGQSIAYARTNKIVPPWSN
jgi:uncharacterized damage-inducible protein DinB